MRRARVFLAILASVVLVRPPAALHASVVVPMSLPQLTGAAALIVDATVVDVRHVVAADGAERLVLVRVAAAWKGAADETLYVRLAGGQVGRYATRVPGVPTVSAGDRLVWFLAPHPRGGYAVIGLHQGALRTMQAQTGETFVSAPARDTTRRGDASRIPRRLADLAGEVQGLLAGVPR